ncbi:NEL-type E3 ubiquitin ligase domain-containing protein [Pseudomonas koreensis]|uniref:RING-type E3 ubiquitin transferase n=1 Tax=Pseudomonas koreensis TaxID=198620 RepID=A0A9X2XI43_9PSED|nr:NEL-type E3 ubiquitin ligase domain-containing protein [Pseudomonas koreensis]MCU7249445.1 NEL-type E3 ubiquitin ligase domain-containing protein [Pseudomonas koreensis]
MSKDPDSTPTASAERKPAATRSIHGDLLEKAIPGWLTDATPERRAALKRAAAPLPPWYLQASASRRQAFNEALTASFSAQTRLDKAMSWLQDIDTFAAPLLSKALKERFNVELDVHKTFLQLRKPLELGILGIDISSFDVLKLPLLQAALHNFEESECERGAFHQSSGFQVQGARAGLMEAVSTSLTVEQFTGLCRTLDIGAKYQAYLKEHLHPEDGVSEAVLREKFSRAQKTALRAAAERALLQKDIEPKDYTSILEIIDGNLQPYQGKKQIWFRDLNLMNRRMTGCMWFTISEKYRYTDEWLIYIPNDPDHPLKRYNPTQTRELFKQRFTAGAQGAGPTLYQRFFSQFVAYADLPYYFSQFTQDTPEQSFDEKLAPYASLLNELLKGANPFGLLFGVDELPPTPAVRQVPNDDPYLRPGSQTRRGDGPGLWAENVDPFQYLFDEYRRKLIDDARHHAVPTADVDARVRSQKFATLLNAGMLVLTTASMFVPVLGEVMMGVMTYPILQEAFAGVIEWSEGDRKAAREHLLDVAQNLALIALTAGAGKALAKWVAVRPEPLIEDLHQVTLPDGKTRLWKADLQGYESAVGFTADFTPDARGQYLLNGKHYIRMGGKTYEQFYDTTAGKWRIRHPSDAQACQPLLTHNHAGAWRLAQERPLAWDRLTLLRRIGHSVEAWSDEELLRIGEISGLSDSALRKMHMDNALPPPQLAEAMRLFDADRGVGQLIEQVASGQSAGSHYLSILPLMSKMPRWPQGRVLEVFEQADLSGASVKYGSERLVPTAPVKPSIRISRTDVRSGELLARILAALDESEIVRLLGGEGARVYDLRPEEFRKQIADYVRTRRPVLFESLYQGTGPLDARVGKLQRVCPGLSEPAAQAVLAQSDSATLARLDSGQRVPLPLQEMARWYAREGRLTRAFGGLYRQSMALPDSARLALHSLEKLPGWPDNLRLEIRDGGIEGRLIDGIGSETAGERKYLVKRGPSYQAFNERGESLNSMSRYEDNFYSSIMHALPDSARRSLGLAEVGRSADLQRAIIDYATAHREASLQVLDEAAGRKRWFKPPQRISATQVGYPASGEFTGMVAALVPRVRDVYPGLLDEQASQFVLSHLRSGKTEQQILHLLNNRMREWEAMETTLNQWVAEVSGAHVSTVAGREFIAQSFKTSWRMSPLADEFVQFRGLNVVSGQALPALTADFSHVRELILMGPGASQLLPCFPNVEVLNFAAPEIAANELFDALAPLKNLKELNLGLHSLHGISEHWGRLPNLQALELLVQRGGVAAEASERLDLSALRQLRHLEVNDEQMREWPDGVLSLPHLELLDLRHTGIAQLPADIHVGHERLLSGLSLDWSRFSREAFRPVYEQFSRQPQRAGDLDGMLKSYCRGQFMGFGGDLPSFYEDLTQPFVESWPYNQARYAAIEKLADQYAQLKQMEAWVADPFDLQDGGYVRASMANVLKTNWRAGLLQRYGSVMSGRLNLFAAGQAAILELGAVGVETLPLLPAEGFTHVTSLRIKGLRAPVAPLREFLRTFSNVKALELKDCGLSELPLQAGDIAGLEHLNLQGNPLATVDVSALTGLQSLDLTRTPLSQWPTGAENLSQLTSLDLRGSRVSSIPPTALARDELVIAANLTDALLTPQARTGLAAARLRIEQARGMEEGTLLRFAHQGVPSEFPPRENAMTLLRRLLPLPPTIEPGSGTPWLVRRLQGLDPGISSTWGEEILERMRGAGTTDAQIAERLDNWQRELEALTRRLNDWLYIREVSGEGWLVSSHTRRLAAQRIVRCWRDRLSGVAGPVGHELGLDGLQLGDLPRLPVSFNDVNELNLTGTRISEQGSNDFLRAFPNLRTLNLSGQALEALPGAVTQMNALQRLELSSTGIQDPASLYFSLATHENLRWLDLSHNLLETFSVENFEHLQGLDLRNNRLSDWPDGVLESTSLTTLNLSGNDIVSIPEQALDGTHEALMAGTDLSDNHNLSLESLQRLFVYTQEEDRGPVLGIPFADIERMMDDYVSESGSISYDGNDTDTLNVSEDDFSPPREEDEFIPELLAQALSRQMEPWLRDVLPEDIEHYRAVWERVAAEPDNGNFFNLLSEMRDTQEFKLHRSDLTRRIWSVMEAADSFADLRQSLFDLARTHTTCVDGRTLALSEIEVKVYVHNALLQVEPGLEQKGRALLALSRRLFRLDEVESLARQAAPHDLDRAEVRLQYRIGMTDGWPDGLTLPGQPRAMKFRRPLDGSHLIDARQQVLNAEQSERFFEVLIGRGYWVDYLKEKYPQAFAELKQRADANLERLEDEHDDLASDAYSERLQMLEIERSTELNLKLLELSRQEVQDNA